MMARDSNRMHDEAWLLLPWLATGQLAPEERERVEEHVRHCPACERELATQHLLSSALAEPDRVTYAPGPSFRKLMERIDSDGARKAAPRVKQKAAARAAPWRFARVSLWRPPGLAWAASFLVLFGVTGLVSTAYRWTDPVYRTHTDAAAVNPNVLHIAFDRSLPIGDVEELLRTSGARIVEGPGNTGIFGVAPAGSLPASAANGQLRVLASRLRADSRVLWVQPLPDDEPATGAASGAPGSAREPASRQP